MMETFPSMPTRHFEFDWTHLTIGFYVPDQEPNKSRAESVLDDGIEEIYKKFSPMHIAAWSNGNSTSLAIETPEGSPSLADMEVAAARCAIDTILGYSRKAYGQEKNSTEAKKKIYCGDVLVRRPGHEVSKSLISAILRKRILYSSESKIGTAKHRPGLGDNKDNTDFDVIAEDILKELNTHVRSDGIDPRISCEWFKGVWYDRVEFLLNLGGEAWTVPPRPLAPDRRPVYFMASISYICSLCVDVLNKPKRNKKRPGFGA